MHYKKHTRLGIPFAMGSALLLASPLAAADLTGVYATPDGELTVAYQDEDHMRLSIAEEQIVLFRPDDFYLLHRQAGEWRYVAGSDLPNIQAGGSGSEGEVELEATGRTEEVAGIEGEVYKARSSSGGETSVTEVVLTDDPRVHELTRALMSLPGRLGDLGAQGGSWQADLPADAEGDLRDKGILRSGDIRLESVSEKAIPDSEFELPPDAQPMMRMLMPSN